MTDLGHAGRRTRLAVVLALGALALGLAACGDDDDGGGGGGGGGSAAEAPVTLQVGVIPIADVAPLYVGMEQGFFEEENLTIEPTLAEGGAAIVPAVIAGENDIGFSNVTSLVIASSQGLPIRIISQGSLAGEGDEDAFDAVFVEKGSAIEDVQDLVGKTISVNTLNNVGPLTINNALEDAGVDPSKVKYIEVPFPDAVAALEAGRVDAIWVVEPFQQQGVEAGFETIMHPFEEAAPNYTVATYFTTEQYIEENPEIIERFTRAMDKALRYAQENPEAVRRVVPTYTQIPEEVAAEMVLPTWKPDLGLNEETIQLTVDLSEKYGYIDEKPALDDLIHRGGSG